jgi:hypothetical protein
VVLAFGVAATSRPAGKASVNVTPVRAAVEVALRLVMVKVRVDVPFTAIGLREKAFASVNFVGSGRVQPVMLTVSR